MERYDEDIINIQDSIEWLEGSVNAYLNYDGSEFELKQINQLVDSIVIDIEEAIISKEDKEDFATDILEILDRLL